MENEGEIYCITSPSGKKYIGQCVKQLSNGKNWGYTQRWKEHIRDSNSRNYCRLLNNAIIKYGSENFTVEIIKECNISELNYYEQYYINSYNTLSPNGYNLTTGGSVCRQSEETQNLKRVSMIGKNLGKQLPKRYRLREEDNNLPKYLRYYTDHLGKEGYRISNHPILKDKSFLSKKIPLNEKLQIALEYLNQQR
jgi:group I intron endonuclease